MSALSLPESRRVGEKTGDPLEYLSASRLKCFQECRLKFFFRYVEQIPTETSVPLFIGRVTHAVLQRWNLNRWRGLPADPDTLESVFHELWNAQPEGLDWGDKERVHQDKTWGMLLHYLEQSPIPANEKPEGVEVLVERDLDVHGLPPLKGVIDLVRNGGRIVDFKTTSRTPDPVLTRHQNELQLGCYALLYREATGHREQGFELHHLVKTKEPKLVVTTMETIVSTRIERLLQVMESYVHGVKAEDYVPSPGQHCSWCDYFAHCRAWQEGGSL